MSLGKDLASIRKERKLTLEDIFSATKIPIQTLKSVENDTLLSESSETPTYLRSFIRSYAKALKIPDEYILEALEKTESGDYDHDLIYLLDPSRKPGTKEVAKKTATTSENESDETDEPATPVAPVKAGSTPKKIEKPTADPIRARSPEVNKPTVATVDWANMSKKVYTSPANSKVWVFFLVIIIVAGLAGSGFYFSEEISTFFNSQFGNSPSDNTDPVTEIDNPVNNSTAVNPGTDQSLTSPVETETTDPALTTLGDTLTIAVYAAFDKLEPVRVTSDLNWRTNPFWMDRGDAYYFDFRDSILVRGQYSRMILLFNGHIINNPRQNNFDPEYDSILLTRNDLNRQEYREPAPEQFPLSVGEPDSIVYRIRF